MKYLFELDLFGKEPNLYYKGKSQKKTIQGLIFTLFYITLFLIYLFYKFDRLIKRKDAVFYYSYEYDNEIPSIVLTKENFTGAFTLGGLIDETLYYIKAHYIREIKNENPKIEELEIEKCNIEKFGIKHRELFKDEPLNKLYCLKNVNQTLEGYSYLEHFSYFNLQIYPCVNQTKDGRPCKNYNTIYNFFKNNFVEFKMQDNLLTPENYTSPVKPSKKDIKCPIFLQIYQKTYSYIQIVRVETNEDITGLNLNSKNKVEVFTKYQDSFVIASPGTAEILKTGGCVCDLTLQLAANVLTQRRNYKTLLDVMEEVGGIMEFLYSFFQIILSYIVNELYEKSLVNNLFNFNITRKVITFKSINNNNKHNINEIKKKSIHDNNISKNNSSRNISMRSNQLSDKDLTKADKSDLPLYTSASNIFKTKNMEKYKKVGVGKSEKYKKERIDKSEKYEKIGENKSEKNEIEEDNKNEKKEIEEDNKSEKYEKEEDKKYKKNEIEGVDKSEKYEKVKENKSEKYEIELDNESVKYENEVNRSEKYENEVNRSEKYENEVDRSEKYENEIDRSEKYENEVDRSEKYDKELDKSEKYDKELDKSEKYDKEVDKKSEKNDEIVLGNENENFEKEVEDKSEKYKKVEENKSEKYDKEEEDKSKKYEKIEENKVIEKINSICLCLICLKNKKRNIEKIYFEEGMKLIREKLDISNLFINSFIVDKQRSDLNIDISKFISKENGKNIQNILDEKKSEI